jgi:hypothetical protein
MFRILEMEDGCFHCLDCRRQRLLGASCEMRVHVVVSDVHRVMAMSIALNLIVIFNYTCDERLMSSIVVRQKCDLWPLLLSMVQIPRHAFSSLNY